MTTHWLKALAPAEEKRLLDGCADSRSRSLLPAVLLALNTGMRYSELRLLRWQQVDLERRAVQVAGAPIAMDTNGHWGLRRLADQPYDCFRDRLVVEEIGGRLLIVQEHPILSSPRDEPLSCRRFSRRPAHTSWAN
jgi:integrase